MPDTSNVSAIQAFLLVYIVVVLAISVFVIICWWKIFSKAGYSGAMSLLFLVPIANIIVFCILAFGRWPIYNELEQLRQQVGRGPQYPATPQYPQYPQAPQYPPR
jgi:heme/copper-type cytochrome/quinol oxidase subunit 2